MRRSTRQTKTIERYADVQLQYNTGKYHGWEDQWDGGPKSGWTDVYNGLKKSLAEEKEADNEDRYIKHYLIDKQLTKTQYECDNFVIEDSSDEYECGSDDDSSSDESSDEELSSS